MRVETPQAVKMTSVDNVRANVSRAEFPVPISTAKVGRAGTFDESIFLLNNIIKDARNRETDAMSRESPNKDPIPLRDGIHLRRTLLHVANDTSN